MTWFNPLNWVRSNIFAPNIDTLNLGSRIYQASACMYNDAVVWSKCLWCTEKRLVVAVGGNWVNVACSLLPSKPSSQILIVISMLEFLWIPISINPFNMCFVNGLWRCFQVECPSACEFSYPQWIMLIGFFTQSSYCGYIKHRLLKSFYLMFYMCFPFDEVKLNLFWFSSLYSCQVLTLHLPSQGAELKVKVNKLTSTKTQLPYSYYSLPYCPPEHIVDSAENLGEVLRGDRIENSPYVVSCSLPVGSLSTCPLLWLLCGWHKHFVAVSNERTAAVQSFMS